MRLFAFTGILVFAGAAVIGFLYLRQPRPHHWKTEEVTRGELIVKVSATGAVEPRQSVLVGSQVSGTVTQVYAQADQAVAAGEKLAAIETDVLEADLRDKECLLQKAKTDLCLMDLQKEKLDIREEHLAVDIRQQQVAIERATINLKQAEVDLVRFQQMFALEAVTRNELDLRILDKENKRCECRQLELQLLALESDRKALATEHKILLAQRKQTNLTMAQAGEELKKAKTNLEHALILAPMAGLVLKRYVEPGQTVAAILTTPELFEIVTDLKQVNIQAKVDEANVGRIQVGQAVTFEVDAYRDETFIGQVKEVRLKNEKDSNLITYPVFIEADNPPAPPSTSRKLRPGMTAYVSFSIEHKKDVLRLPAAALRYVPASDVRPQAAVAPLSEAEAPRYGMPATVYVSNGDKLRAIAVRVGDNDGRYYELLAGGLKAGERVVTAEIHDPEQP